MAFAGTFLAIADDAAPFPDLIPAKLVIFYGHDMGGSAVIELKGGKVSYKLDSLGQERARGYVEPTPEQWSAFIARLNEAKVYKWDGHYNGSLPGPLDSGFRWSFAIQLGEILFVSDGNSAFPPDGDIDPAKRKSPNASFNLMSRAVSQLIGHDFP